MDTFIHTVDKRATAALWRESLEQSIQREEEEKGRKEPFQNTLIKGQLEYSGQIKLKQMYPFQHLPFQKLRLPVGMKKLVLQFLLSSVASVLWESY